MTDWVLTGCEPDEAERLIKNYHYSRRMPSNVQHCYAVRERGGMFGDTGPVMAAAMFSIPPTRWSEDVLELSRLVRSPSCNMPLSKLLAYACGWLKKSRHNLLVSFADRTQRHHGGIYQASGWIYGGCRDRRMDGVIIDGRFVPGRSANSMYGTRSPDRLKERGIVAEPHYDEGKHLYWKVLHNSGAVKAKRLGLQSKPYPKEFAARRSDSIGTPDVSHVQPVGAAP